MTISSSHKAFAGLLRLSETTRSQSNFSSKKTTPNGKNYADLVASNRANRKIESNSIA